MRCPYKTLHLPNATLKDQGFPDKDESGVLKGQDQARCVDVQIHVLLHQNEDPQEIGISSSLID